MIGLASCFLLLCGWGIGFIQTYKFLCALHRLPREWPLSLATSASIHRSHPHTYPILSLLPGLPVYVAASLLRFPLLVGKPASLIPFLRSSSGLISNGQVPVGPWVPECGKHTADQVGPVPSYSVAPSGVLSGVLCAVSGDTLRSPISLEPTPAPLLST